MNKSLKVSMAFVAGILIGGLVGAGLFAVLASEVPSSLLSEKDEIGRVDGKVVHAKVLPANLKKKLVEIDRQRVSQLKSVLEAYYLSLHVEEVPEPADPEINALLALEAVQGQLSALNDEEKKKWAVNYLQQQRKREQERHLLKAAFEKNAIQISIEGIE